MATPAQNLAWLKKNHPGVTLAQWHAQTKAAAKLKHPSTPARQGIPSTIADVQAVRNSLWHPKQAYADALAEATAAGNAQLEGLPDQTKLESDAGQMASVIKGFGDNLFTQLGNVQTANADSANKTLSLFKNNTANADQAAAAQIIAAGGGAPQTGPTAPVAGTPSLPNTLPGTTSASTAPGATDSLLNLATNQNNVFGARSYAAGQQELLDQRQNQNDLKKSIYQLNQNKDKVQQQAAADALSLFRNERQNVENQIPSYLNYSLYNTRNTTNAKIAGDKLTQTKTNDAATQAYHTAMQGIAQQNADTKRRLADGTYTPKQASLINKKTSAYKDVISHAPGAPGVASTTEWRIPYELPGAPTGQFTTDKNGNVVPITTTKKGVYKATQAQYQAYLAKMKQFPNQSNLDVFGLKGGTKTGPITSKSTSSGQTSAKWKRAAAFLYMQQAGYTDPKVINQKLDAAGY